MKNWVWIVLVALISYLTIKIFKIPFFAFLIVGIPVLTIILTYVSFHYSFRPLLNPEPIPAKGYEPRIIELERDVPVLKQMGFDKIDSFYLKMIPDSIVYVFKKKEGPVYFCLYHLGTKKACDIVSYFEKNITLTTCNNVDGGMTPRPDNRLLQIFEKLSYIAFLERHQQAQEFIRGRGFKQTEAPSVTFREDFMKGIREFADYVKKISFWPLLLIIWTITKRGRIYLNKSIEEQYRSGMIKTL